MKRLLTIRKYHYQIDNNKFNFKTLTRKNINFSSEYKKNFKDKNYLTLEWGDVLKKYTNNKIKFQELIPKNIYPKVISFEDLKYYENKEKFYVKPISGSNGDKIYVLTKSEIFKKKFDEKKFFIQEYIKPHLINKKKYDIRMYYFVIKHNFKIKTWVSLNGKIRLCQDVFSKGTSFSEITNSSQIKKLENLNELQGNLNNLPIDDRNEIFKVINQLDEKLKIKLEDDNIGDFINLYGIDIIKDSNGKFWILEINGNPHWQVNSDSDDINIIKTDIFDEILKILSNEYYFSKYDLNNWKLCDKNKVNNKIQPLIKDKVENEPELIEESSEDNDSEEKFNIYKDLLKKEKKIVSIKKNKKKLRKLKNINKAL